MNDNTTHVIFAADARKQLWAGMKIAADAVTTTLGPKGRTVIIQRANQSPLVTKDGITVAKSIKLKDPVKRMGAELILEAANQTNEVAGDGTTTATCLTAALVAEGLKLVEGGFSPLELCKGIEAATGLVLAALKQQAVQVSTSAAVAQVGTISANGDAQIGKLIADAMEHVGRDGIITVEDAKGMATSMSIADGMQFERGYISPYFVTDAERMRATYDDAFVLVTDKKISSLKELIPLLERVVRLQKGLLIIAEDVDGDALTGLVLNRVKSGLPVVAIKAPGYGLHRQELLHDICVMTGATLVSSANGLTLDKVTDANLGRVKRFNTDAKSTTLVGTGAQKTHIDTHVVELRKQLEDITLGQDEVTKLKVRIAKLASGVAVIRVGGATEVEMTERRFRVEDALNATKAAVEEGIVPGGGMAFYHAVHAVKSTTVDEATGAHDEQAGMGVVYRACLAPLKRIIENAGASSPVVLAELARRDAAAPLINDNMGYNAATGEYVDLVTAGVVDPVKVARTALKNAASVAVTFLSLDAVVYDEQVTKEQHADEQ